MSNIIAVAGKGGVGKTTVCGMLIRYLLEMTDKRPILAVDGDPNSNLNEILGLEVYTTIGDARELLKRDVPLGMTKDVWFEYKVHEAIIEADGFDLLVMGRPEGPGCYCAANSLAKRYIDMLKENYFFVVIDNEAGMEHISRLVTQDIDHLYVVSDSTPRGIMTAKRIIGLIKELNLNIRQSQIMINRVREGEQDKIADLARQKGVEVVGLIRDDDELVRNDMDGKTIFSLGKESKALKDAYEVFNMTLRFPSPFAGEG